MAQEPAADKFVALLQSRFKLPSFRPLQREVIEALLQGKDAAVIMPTGGGKTLTYAFPAVAKRGVAFVVSPLIALMTDQVNGFKAKGIPAAALFSGANETARDAVYADLETMESKTKMVFVTPEGVAKTERLNRAMSSLHDRGMLSLIAIDEAHCISELGHEFRPEYRRLGVLKQRYPDVPIVAVTATATPAVLNDILTQLHIPHALKFQQSFDRTNLGFQVVYKDALKSPLDDLVASITQALGMGLSSYGSSGAKHASSASASSSSSSGSGNASSSSRAASGGCAIVYTHKRDDVDTLVGALSRAGVPSVGYHAGMNDTARTTAQTAWTSGRCKVVVATTAFGMVRLQAQKGF